MAGNPLIAQGTLNRLLGSVQFDDLPNLNVTPPFLGKEAIRLSLEGEATDTIPTLTGVVQSPAVYRPVSIVMHLLKSQPLADAYKMQEQSSTLLGNFTFRPDVETLSPYQILNGALQGVTEVDASGTSADYAVRITGYWLINQDLWNL